MSRYRRNVFVRMMDSFLDNFFNWVLVFTIAGAAVGGFYYVSNLEPECHVVESKESEMWTYEFESGDLEVEVDENTYNRVKVGSEFCTHWSVDD